jgi:hypothetical protein
VVRVIVRARLVVRPVTAAITMALTTVSVPAGVAISAVTMPPEDRRPQENAAKQQAS